MADDVVDVDATLAQLKGQQEKLQAGFSELRGLSQKAQEAMNTSKAELTAFNDKYGRVLTLLEE